MSDRKQVVVLYAEAQLQKSIDLPGSFTVAKAKKEGMAAIRDHLKTLPGVPPVTFDPDCTDFYPATKDNTIIRSLKGNPTMVVYPEPPKGQTLTPSPFVDALQSAIRELRDLKAQQNSASLIRDESTENDVKPSYSDNDIISKLEAMEQRFGQEITELRRENAELRQENAGLKHKITDLNAMMAEAEMMLRNSKDVSGYWKAVGRDSSLIHRNCIGTRAHIAAHSSTTKSIADSVLALTSEGDRNGMITTVYNSERSS